MKFITTIFVIILALGEVCGQTVVMDLNGFRIGQFRETVSNEFGKPIQQDKYKDGFEYEVFNIKPDTSVYMVFEYSAERTDVIWSIQISGKDKTADIGFKGLRLGIDKKEVESVLGKPDQKQDLGKHGEKWSFENTNYSIEISREGELSSVKITDNYSGEVPDVSKLPKFEDVVKILRSKKNSEIAGVLAPGIEIYYKDQTLFFNKSWKNEIETDYSKIYDTIRELSKELDKINTSDEDSYEENMRMTEEPAVRHVVKIKTGHVIKEIVFEYINGQYLIWEILAQ